MGDFLKSAFDYFGNTAKSKTTNELVGNNIEIGSQTFKVVNTIAEGGFSVVYEAQDNKTNKCYAIKRLISQDAETNKEIMQEINILKKLSGHPNIIKLYSAASIGQERQRQMGTEFLILTEYCRGGQLIQLMQRRNKPFPFQVIIQIFNHVAKAVEHMHNQNPSLIHRDLKVENLLINDRSVIKLCDFGSATTEIHTPDNTWTGLRRGEVQEEIEKHTTPMYRAPEMLDLYQNFPINQACDIWALGCVLYYLYTNKHPFEDSAKLAILNAKYTIPTNIEVNQGICGLIYQMLLIDPRQRPTISEVLNDIRCQAGDQNVVLKQSIIFDKESLHHLPHLSLIPDNEEDGGTPSKPSSAASSRNMKKPTPPVPPSPVPPTTTTTSPQPPSQILNNKSPSISNTHSPSPRHRNYDATPTPRAPRPPPPQPSQPTTAQHSQPGTNNDSRKMFGMLKEGAGHLMKNIKDASNKVMEQVSSTMNKSDLSITYVTSRILMMPTPGESGIDMITRDKIEDVQTFLDFRHPNQYFIYNLSLRTIKTDKFKDRVIQKAFDNSKTPPLTELVELLIHQRDWLSRNDKNVVVVQCSDGRILSSMCIAALLCWCYLVDHSKTALDIVRFRRGDCPLTQSQLRYVDYVCRLVRSNDDNKNHIVNIPHTRLVRLTGLVLQPVPIFNRSRTGIRPLIEIFCNYKLVYSNITNYEDLKVFTDDQNQAKLSIPKINVYGDLNVIIYHTRSNIVSKGKMSSTKVCEFQVFTGYLDKSCTEILLYKQQLDHLDFDDEKYPDQFSVTLQLSVLNLDASESEENSSCQFWTKDKIKRSLDQMYKSTGDDRLLLFSSRDEMTSCISSAQVRIPSKLKKNISEEKPSPDKKPIKNKVGNSENFFETLEWDTSGNGENPDGMNERILEFGSSEEKGGGGNGEYGTVKKEPDESVYEEIEDPYDETNNMSNNAIGDLLGDFGSGNNEEDVCGKISTTQQDSSEMGMDGLVDFLTAFPDQNSQGGGSQNVSVTKTTVLTDDFLGSVEPRERSNVSLLLLDNETSSNNQMNDPLDLFGTNNKTTNTTKNTPIGQKINKEDDWTNLLFSNTTTKDDSSTLQPSSTVKQASSTNNLLLLGTSNATSDFDFLLDNNSTTNTQASINNTAGFGVKNSPSFNSNLMNDAKRPLTSNNLVMGGGIDNQQKKISGSDFDIFSSTLTNKQQNNKPTSNFTTPTKSSVNMKKKSGGGPTPPPPPPKPKPNLLKTQPTNNGGVPEKPKDAFQDLLGDFKPQNSGFSDNGGGKSMKEMKKATRAKTTDPEVLKIEEWIDGRERNIRALLCSLNTMLWDGVRWNGVNMAELVTVDQVKRAYKNAIRCVHPDKWNNSEHENLAKLIMIELNDAMTEFEEERNAAS